MIKPDTLVDFVTVHIVKPLVEHAMHGSLPDAPPATMADVVAGRVPMRAFLQQWTTPPSLPLVAASTVVLAGAALVVALRRARRS